MPTEPEPGPEPGPERVDTTQPDANNEQRLIEQAQREICEAFPWLPNERVSAIVEGIWANYDHARIRDFIPVLVRKQAREELRDHLHTQTTHTTPTTPRLDEPPTTHATQHDAAPTPAANSTRSLRTRSSHLFGEPSPQSLLGTPSDS